MNRQDAKLTALISIDSLSALCPMWFNRLGVYSVEAQHARWLPSFSRHSTSNRQRNDDPKTRFYGELFGVNVPRPPVVDFQLLHYHLPQIDAADTR